jgi:hypothetical protein
MVHARPRPDAAWQVVDGMKVHRHRVHLDGRPYTAITPRPGTRSRFSTNRFHGTWHVLSDWHGARLLGRLLWGLAYQRVPGTFVLIDRPFLDPNPFDAEPADPIALVPAALTPIRGGAARALRRSLPLAGSPAGTVRWRTHGLDAAVDAERERLAAPPGARRLPRVPEARVARVDRIGGLLVIAATSAALKDYAVSVYRLGEYAMGGMDYNQIAWPAGEVQVFTDYHRRVSAARTARREVLAGLPDPLPPADLNALVWDRGTAVRRRRLRPPRAHNPPAGPV